MVLDHLFLFSKHFGLSLDFVFHSFESKLTAKITCAIIFFLLLFEPLNTITLNVGQKLLDDYSIVFKFRSLLLSCWEIKLNLGKDLIRGVIEDFGYFSPTTRTSGQCFELV